MCSHLRGGGGGTPSQVWGVPHLRSDVGGYPGQVLGRVPWPGLDVGEGVPHLRLGGRVPQPGLDDGGHPISGLRGGTPPQIWDGVPPQTWDGVPPRPGMGYPQTWNGVPPRPGMGYPPDLGWGTPQTWDGVPPRHGMGYPPDMGWGTPLDMGQGTPPTQISIANTCYVAGSMPLAFTQDFLVQGMYRVPTFFL